MSRKTWHSGPPPSVGWWPTRARGGLEGPRWFDGRTWSVFADPSSSARVAGTLSSIKTGLNDIDWTDRPNNWPARSRT